MANQSYLSLGNNRFREDFGFYFEDFTVGQIIEHRPGRTITQNDNIWFTLLTMNTAQLHFDVHYAEQTEWKKPIVNSTFTLAIITGMTVNTISKKVVANLAWDKVKLLKPVFEGDTIYAETEIKAKRESISRPTQGIITVETRGINQHKEIFMSFERTVLVYKKGGAPDYSI
ncbi:MaoC/PaaZ C-terminal domain-containing protein [Legionella micdadei]|uniref:Itaconyl-CoA hydratase n=1 Tax=Legionella micdadei TaxID=451 RepID=A0A098GE08_LEGMI|nr:MaoC/PaaZ C-terminal domain-containing protein [Legionella micdadei]ARG98128.1 molybdenum cofactor biosynthesis protein MoeC [Legionella micdadei]ARH00926.1 molybdenum cofactor biosynthesis protein MoeC [Legionella micdadei]KTD30028.1 acyl dehydratase MaoC [Legionella micdadei]NSL18593.1 MaoC family dehydratase [Legionella micdadei]CEG60220.1 putative MaoC-like dehydratase [Legionella micdadei]